MFIYINIRSKELTNGGLKRVVVLGELFIYLEVWKEWVQEK